jgi:hypothetical protein
MRRLIRKFGAGLAGVALAAALAFGASGLLTGSADASTGRGNVTIVDKSCNSSAGGLIAVNALNCNDIEILNDLIDVGLIGNSFDN